MILTKPTDAQLAAIARIYNTDDFRLFRAFLEADARAQDDELRKVSDDVHTRRIQGSAQYVRELLQMLEGAREATERRNNPRVYNTKSF